MKNNYYDEMEIGKSGWVPFKDGFKNINNGHTIDSLGREFDENGVMIFDSTKEDQE